MHIGFITPEYPHDTLPSSGGLGTSIKNLAEALVLTGVKVSVFVVGTENSRSFVEKSIRFYFINKIKFPGFTWLVTRKYYQKRISKIVKNQRIDILEAPDWTGITAFMKFNVPLVLRLHGSDAYFCHLEGRKQKIKNYWFEKNALKKATSILSVSNYTADLTKRIFKLKKRVVTIHNGINIKAFAPSLDPLEGNNVLYFGTIIRKKGVFELAKIFNHLKRKNSSVILKIIGKDSTDKETGESSLKLFFKYIDLRFHKDVLYMPHLPYEEIKNEINKANVIVLPSLAEAFPMAWLEAMAMEKALVTSNIGWAKEMMIDGVTGFMVCPNNHEEYAERIHELLKNELKRVKFGFNARKRILECFSSELITNKNIQYYKSLLK